MEKIISFVFLVPSSLLSTVSALGAAEYRRSQAGTAVPRCASHLYCSWFRTYRFRSGAGCRRTGGGAVHQRQRGADGWRSVFPRYIWDCIFAGIHFSFSGYFCACEKSVLSFLHNIIAIALVRLPGVYLTSKLFPTTLFPMGLATATGSLLSVIICVIAFAVLTRHGKQTQEGGLTHG